MSARLQQLLILDAERRRLRHKRLQGQSTPPADQREDDLTDRLITGLVEALRDVAQKALHAANTARRRGY